jgi:hypothetical protein
MHQPDPLLEPADKFDYQKSVRKTEDKYIFPFLRIDKFINRRSTGPASPPTS